MEEQPHRTCERTKSKQKQNQVTSHSNWSAVLPQSAIIFSKLIIGTLEQSVKFVQN